MKSTRENILHTLMKKRRATINELSEIVGINGISVRHHLINLQAEGLITAEEERHGVGRPRFVYTLTEKGLEKFPTNYLTLTDELLDKIKAMLSKDKVTELYQYIGISQAQKKTNIDPNLPIEQQLQQLADQLLEDGFFLSWEKAGNDIVLYSDNCPYAHIGRLHPDICEIDRTMFSTALAREVRLDKCVLQDNERCSYIIKL